MHFNPFPTIKIQYHRTMAHCRRCLYFATSFSSQRPFQQNLWSIDFMMKNSLVEIQDVVAEQLSRNRLIMQTQFENRLPPNFLFFSIINFLVEQAGSTCAANIASSRASSSGFDSVASDSNWLPWQPTNPQRFWPHFGIRTLFDQSESMGSSGISRNIFIWVLVLVGLGQLCHWT